MSPDPKVKEFITGGDESRALLLLFSSASVESLSLLWGVNGGKALESSKGPRLQARARNSMGSFGISGAALTHANVSSSWMMLLSTRIREEEQELEEEEEVLGSILIACYYLRCMHGLSSLLALY